MSRQHSAAPVRQSSSPSSSWTLSPSAANSPSSTSAPTEYRVLLMGTRHKRPFFEKLQLAAQRFEQHVQYADTCYLTFQVPETTDIGGSGRREPVVLELVDPGTEHTGAREMAIRKADAALLCYAAYSPASFHTLASIAEDFKCLEANRLPTGLLVCNGDQLVEEGEGEEQDGEGQSDSGRRTTSPRRPSLERIRTAREEGECPVTREQGEQLARLFGPDCEFQVLSFSALSQGELCRMVAQLVRRAQQRRQGRQRSQSRGPSSSRRRLSPIVPILRRTSLKKLLTHSKSDPKDPHHNGQQQQGKTKRMSQPPAEQCSSSQSASSTEGGGPGEQKANGNGGKERQRNGLGNALRVLVQPGSREKRAKSQNKVAAAASDANSSLSLPNDRTPSGHQLEVIPPTGEPLPAEEEPFSFTSEPVRVNNFVGEEVGVVEQQSNGKGNNMPNGSGGSANRNGSLERPVAVNKRTFLFRSRASSNPPNSSSACVIQ